MLPCACNQIRQRSQQHMVVCNQEVFKSNPELGVSYCTCITQFIILLRFSNPCAKIATCKSSSCKLEKLLSEQNLVSSYFWIEANQGNVFTSGINWGHLTISTIISLRDYFITVPVKYQHYESAQV